MPPLAGVSKGTLYCLSRSKGKSCSKAGSSAERLSNAEAVAAEAAQHDNSYADLLRNLFT